MGVVLDGYIIVKRGLWGYFPLLPPWVDQGPGPLPEPDKDRFRTFRLKLGKFVSSGDAKDLRSAVGHFARSSSGGASVAKTRISPIATVGGNLIGLISDLQSGGDGTALAGEDLSSCLGAEIDVAIEKIVEALTPDNGDADKISAAMQSALLEVLEDDASFDPLSISSDDLVSLISAYLVEAIFLWIISESDKSFQKADSGPKANKAEASLRELVKVSVEDALGAKNLTNIGALKPNDIAELEREVTHEVFQVWEGYE